MKTRSYVSKVTLLLLLTYSGYCQGVFVYDQQSSTDETPFPGSGGVIQQGSPGVGQSFTPTFPSLDFIRLKLSDNSLGNSVGAVLYLNLRTNSIAGAIIGSTLAVPLPDNFAGTTNFFFATSVPLSPGATYYFQPVVQSGDPWNLDVSEYNYPGGMAFYQGVALPGGDAWFREGIVVPEPSSASVVLMGAGLVAWRRFRRGRF